MVSMAEHRRYIRKALCLARQARQRGDHPFGALLVKGARVLLTARNTVNTRHDATRHAELNLVSTACRRFRRSTRAACTLYASTEPCAMCAAAAYWAGIGRVVYGCPAEVLGAMTGGTLAIPCRHIFQPGKRRVRVLGPVLAAEAAEVHRGFWLPHAPRPETRSRHPRPPKDRGRQRGRRQP